MLGPRLCFAWSLSREQSRGAEHGCSRRRRCSGQCVALAMQCNNRLGLNFELRCVSTSNYECWTADSGPKWPRRLCVCRCAPSWCGTRGMMRPSSNHLRDLSLSLSRISQPPDASRRAKSSTRLGEAGEASDIASAKDGTHSCLHATAASISDASL